MIPHTASWQEFCKKELAVLQPLLSKLGFALEETQVHLGGERSVISGKKLVLMGYRVTDHARVIIKASTHPEGKKELIHGHTCRALLNQIQFAYTVFLSPEELVWHEEDGCLISISTYIEQTSTFLDRPFKEQFFLALKAFETQESAHATTYEHARAIRGTFGLFDTSDYLAKFTEHCKTILNGLPTHQEISTLLERASSFLQTSQDRIEQYNGFLTHTDFVPHNIRIVDRDIYLLDHSAIHFGNKYEGWARFLNFMLLYHRELEQALITYVEQNRSPEEREALQLMRVYRLAELIAYYVKRLPKTEGDLHALDQARVFFWIDVLRSLLDEKTLPQERITTYQTLRDSLRSDEEKKRQKGLH